MSDQYLYQQIFNIDKKQPNQILNGLFAMQLPVAKKNEVELKKSKSEEQLNKYLSSTKKNNDRASELKKTKQAQSNWPATQKPNHTPKISEVKSPKPQPAVIRTSEKLQAKYMPNIVDPFAKKEAKPNLPRENAGADPIKKRQEKHIKSQSPAQSKETIHKNSITKPERIVSNAIGKTQAKGEKIKRKEQQQLRKQPRENINSNKNQISLVKARPTNKQEKKKKKDQSSSSSSSSSQQSSSGSNGQEDWRKQIRKVTGYDPTAKKFRERDRMNIKESSVQQMFGQDKFSYKMGILQEEEDLRLEEQKRRRALKKAQHQKHR